MTRVARLLLLVFAVVSFLAGGAQAAPMTIYPTPTTGYSVTFPGSSVSNQPIPGYPGWFYWGRGNATVGITGTYPQSGFGSFYLQGVGSSSQGGVLYTPGIILGSLADFTGGSYDWYRSSSSTNPTTQAPAFALIVDFDGNPLTTGDIRFLNYEPIYNGSSIPTNTWVTENITTSSIFWSTYNNSLGNSPLTTWVSTYPNAVVLGFTSYFGSGWNGQFFGGVDNLSWQFSNQPQAGPFNFEVEVPEPATLATLGLMLTGTWVLRRRRS